jgi:hypothetical protein
VRLAIAILLLFAGCAARTPPIPPMVLRSDLIPSAAHWRAEAVKRFGPQVYVFACHGAQFDNGTWQCVTEDGQYRSVEGAARFLSELWPERAIVLVCCNPNGREITVPRHNVYYVRKNVTQEPGAFNDTCENSIWAFRN